MGVAAVLGHNSGQMVQSVYGRFAPNAIEMKRWQEAATLAGKPEAGEER